MHFSFENSSIQTDELVWTVQNIREGAPKKNGFIWDFVPNIGPHPPTARVWDSTKWKIKVKFILLFRLFGAFYFFEEMSSFSDKIPCIYLGLWTPTHPPPPLFWNKVLKKAGFCRMVIFTKKFWTLDPNLPIVWDKVPKKNVFFTPSLINSQYSGI